MTIATVNPSTGQTERTFDPLSAAQIEGKLELAARAFSTYRRMAFAQRSRLMQRAAEILESDKSDYARLMTREMGKTFRSAVEEVLKCAAPATTMPKTPSVFSSPKKRGLMATAVASFTSP